MFEESLIIIPDSNLHQMQLSTSTAIQFLNLLRSTNVDKSVTLLQAWSNLLVLNRTFWSCVSSPCHKLLVGLCQFVKNPRSTDSIFKLLDWDCKGKSKRLFQVCSKVTDLPTQVYPKAFKIGLQVSLKLVFGKNWNDNFEILQS